MLCELIQQQQCRVVSPASSPSCAMWSSSLNSEDSYSLSHDEEAKVFPHQHINSDDLPSFAMIQKVSLDQYLKTIKIIFDLDKDGRIPKRDVLKSFYEEVKSSPTREMLVATVTNIDGNYLSNLYLENEIPDKAYDVKTKLRSLFYSIYIQKILFFAYRENPFQFLKIAREEVAKLLTSAVFDSYLPEEQASIVNFYIVLREAKNYQTHSKWEKFAFYTISMGVGEGVWYCPGGGAKPTTARRSSLYRIFENKTSPDDAETAATLTLPTIVAKTALVSPAPIKVKVCKPSDTPKKTPKKMAKQEQHVQAVVLPQPQKSEPKKRGRPPKRDAVVLSEEESSTSTGNDNSKPIKRRKVETKKKTPVAASIPTAAIPVDFSFLGESYPVPTQFTSVVEGTDAEEITQDEYSLDEDFDILGFDFDFSS